MARGRFISESVAKDARLNSLSVEAQLVYLMTIPHLDRDGLIEGDPDVLWGTVCPKRRQFLDRMAEFIQEWAKAELVLMYDTEDGPVLWFKGFAKNQQGMRYDREAPSKFSPPPSNNAPPPPAPTPDELRTNSGNCLAEVKDQVEVKVEGEPTPAHAPAPSTTLLPAAKVLHYKSPYLVPNRFVDNRIPAGTGINAVEIYYERFSINQDGARLSAIKEDDLVACCKDLDKLREVVTAYSQTTYQPGNVKLILDWYRDGIPNKRAAPDAAPPKKGIEAFWQVARAQGANI